MTNPRPKLELSWPTFPSSMFGENDGGISHLDSTQVIFSGCKKNEQSTYLTWLDGVYVGEIISWMLLTVNETVTGPPPIKS